MKKFSAKKFVAEQSKKYTSLSNKKILSAVSGGVDSTTSSLLLSSFGLNVDCLIIDTGFLRSNEVANVCKMFGRIALKYTVVDKSEIFFRALEGVADPVQKREIFRNTYFAVLSEYIAENNYQCLVQGTQFEQIGFEGRNSNNHVTDDFKKTNIELIEPVAGLTKNKIRLIAKFLGAPEEVVARRPFPGPGLLIRFSGRCTLSKISTIRRATELVEKYFDRRNNKQIYQIVVYLMSEAKIPYIRANHQGGYGDMLLIKIVYQKVEGDDIAYGPVQISSTVLDELVQQLMSIDGIARVCWDLTKKEGFGSNVKPGGTIEYI